MTGNVTDFRGWLLANPKTKYACDDAIDWIGDRDFATAWKECENPEWMLWLCGQMEGSPSWPTRQQIVLVACEIARSVIHLTRPEDRDVCLAAIVASELWANGTGTADAADAAARAAYASARAAARAAADAAYAAARASAHAAYASAHASAHAAYASAHAAADAAARAADAVDHAVAYAAKRREICDLIRSRLDMSNAGFEEVG